MTPASLDRLLAAAGEFDASDLHLVAGVPPAFRVNGEIIIADEDSISQGEVEETIVIDSEPFSVSIPLRREELVSVLLLLLGPEGELTGAIRSFLAESKLSVDALDRVVCMGWYGRLTLLRESLWEVFKRPVLVVEQLPTVGTPESRLMPVRATSQTTAKISVIVSDPERERREKT